MKLVPLTPFSLLRLERLARLFFKESGLPGVFDWSGFVRWWSLAGPTVFGSIAESDSGEVLGMVGGVLTKCPFTGSLHSSEMFWFVDPEKRGGSTAIRLLSEFEKSSRARGARYCVMACLSELKSDRLSEFFVSRGYSRVETHFRKEL